MRLSLFMVCFVMLLGGNLQAYELTGASWNLSAYPGGIPWCPKVDSAADANTSAKREQFITELRNAMNRWSGNELQCSSYVHRETTCGGSPFADSEQPWVYWEGNWGSVPGVGSSTIGITLSWMSGSLYAAGKVIFNDRDYYWDTAGQQTDVGSIATHEFGHFVGMDHYDERDASKRQECQYGSQSPAVMCASYVGGVMRQLSADDIAGVCSIYPNNGAIGSPCDSNSDCRGGICHADGYCTESCVTAGQCPSGYDCVNGQCQRESGGSSCSACGELPCLATSSCVGSGSLEFCSNACFGPSDCPLGFICASAQGGSSMCWPAGNSCNADGPGAGDTCGSGGVCGLGNVCLGSGSAQTCYQVCQGAWDCPTGESCVETSQPGLRYCDGTSGGGTSGGDCSCNVDSTCNAECTCDPDCTDTVSVSPCACDVYYGCDEDCACDIECICECDEYYGCDAGCDCDSECKGCFNAALLPQLGNAHVTDLSPLIVVLGGLFLYRRRRGRYRA